MDRQIVIEPISHASFAPFGDVLDCSGDPDAIINAGKCGRYNDRAKLEFKDARAGLSLFHAEVRSLPYALDLVERHPLGSQAFIPMDDQPFLVIVAPDAGGAPGTPRAFLTAPGQVINFHAGTWHGVLTPIAGNGLFAVVDRIGAGKNLEEFRFNTPYLVVMSHNPADTEAANTHS